MVWSARVPRRALVLTAVVAAILWSQAADAQPLAYVLGQRGSGNAVVTVIDTATNTKLAHIPVGANCLCVDPNSIAASPDGTRVYATNEMANSLSVIDTV